MLSGFINKPKFRKIVETTDVFATAAEEFVKAELDNVIDRALRYDPLVGREFGLNAFDCAAVESYDSGPIGLAVTCHYVMAHGTMLCDIFDDVTEEDVERCAMAHGRMAGEFLAFVMARNALMTDKGIPFAVSILGEVGRKLHDALTPEVINKLRSDEKLRKAIFIWSPSAISGLADDNTKITVERAGANANI